MSKLCYNGYSQQPGATVVDMPLTENHTSKYVILAYFR